MAYRNTKSTGAIRKNTNYRNSYSQNEVLRKLYDLFEDVIDKQIIACVAKSCKYDLTSSINTLLKRADEHNNRCEAVIKVNKKPQKNTTEKYLQSSSVHQTNFENCINKINKGYKVLVLLRGVPGSGKSTLSKKIYEMTVCNLEGVKPKLHIYSTDDYFIYIGNGHYNFNPLFLNEAHMWNQKRVFNGMQRGISPIIIDNTNVMAWEMRPYVIGAVQNGYIIEVMEPNTPWNFNVRELANRCTHNVPRTTIQEMINRYERNITPQGLLTMFSVQYSISTRPPQKRQFPAINISSKIDTEKVNQTTLSKKTKSKKNIKSNNKDLYPESSILKISEIKKDKLISNVNDQQSDSHFNPKPKQSLATFLKINCSPDSSDLSSENFDNSFDSDTKNSYSSCKSEQTKDEINYCQAFTLIMDTGDMIHSEDSDKEKTSSLYKSEQNKEVNYCRAFTLIMDNGDLIHSEDSFEDKSMLIKESESLPEITDFDNNYDNIIRYTHDDLVNILNQTDREYVNSVLKYSTPKPERKKRPRTNNTIIKLDQEQSDENENAHDLIAWDIFPQDAWDDSNPQMLSDNVENLMSVSCDYLTENNNHKNMDLLGSSLNSEDSNYLIQPLIQVEDISNSNTLQKSESFEKSAEKYSLLNEQDVLKNAPSQINQDINSFEFNNLINLDIVKNTENIVEDTENIVEDTENIVEDTENIVEDTENIVENAENIIENAENIIENVENIAENADNIAENAEKIVENVENFVKLFRSNDDICGLYNFNTSSVSTVKNDNEINSDSLLSINKDSSKDLLQKNNEQNKKNLSIRNFFRFPFFNTSNKKNESDVIANEIVMNKSEEMPKNKIDKKEMSTNTEDNDFKLLTDDTTNLQIEGICVLRAFSHNINEFTTSVSNVKINPPKILMLDKSTITGNESIYLDSVSDEQSKKDFKTLVELFPDFSEDNLRDIFEKCKKNIDWAVDLLLDSKHVIFSTKSVESPKIFDNKTESNIEEETNNSETEFQNSYEPYVEEKISFIDQQDSEESSSAQLNTVIVKKKSKKSQSPSESSLELKKKIEEQFVIPDNFYSEHCLKIKKIRHGILEPDFKDLGKVPLSEEIKKEDCDDSTETESIEEEEDESMEIDLGVNVIKQLELNFGSAFKESKFVESLRPVIQLPMSVARQLHAFWLESAIEQLCVYEEQLEKMMKEDQEFAQRLQEKENELLITGKEPMVSNLQEILDMEIALAIAKSNKKHSNRESFDEISLKLTQEKLYELFPDLDKDSICHILQAYDNKFDQTVDVLSFTRNQMLDENDIVFGFSKEEISKQEQKLLIKAKEANLQKTESNQSKPTIIVTNSCNSSTKKYEQENKMELADYYRAEAQYQLSLRNCCIQKAQAAYNKGLTQVALYYTEVASLHKQNFERANALAASSFLSAHAQANSNSVVLDLHYLFKIEALEALDVFLDKHISLLAFKQKKYEFLYLITGRGLRSNNGQPVIKPAVIKRLKQRNLRFIEVNSGFLRVKIRPNDIMTCNVQV